MKKIDKLPFKEGSPLNFFYKMRLKRGLTQEAFGKKVSRHGSAVCNYENASDRIPESLVLEIPTIFKFSNYEKGQFKKFLKEAENRVERKERGVGKKNHIVKSGWKKNGSSKIKMTQKASAKRGNGLSAQDKANLKFLEIFLNKKGGKEALKNLLKLNKFIKTLA